MSLRCVVTANGASVRIVSSGSSSSEMLLPKSTHAPIFVLSSEVSNAASSPAV